MNKDVPIKNNGTAKKTSDETIRTTDSMRAKANVLSRCFISILKIFRMCKKTPNKRGTA